MQPMTPTAGEALASLRRAAGMSQGDLAKAVGIARTQVHRLELDQCRPRDTTAELIARVFAEKFGIPAALIRKALS